MICSTSRPQLPPAGSLPCLLASWAELFQKYLPSDAASILSLSLGGPLSEDSRTIPTKHLWELWTPLCSQGRGVSVVFTGLSQCCWAVCSGEASVPPARCSDQCVVHRCPVSLSTCQARWAPFWSFLSPLHPYRDSWAPLAPTSHLTPRLQ